MIYTPYIWLLIISALGLTGIFVYTFRFDPSYPAVHPFRMMMFLGVLISLNYALAISIPILSIRVFLGNLNAIFAMFDGFAALMLALSYAGRREWFTLQRRILLLVVPIALTILAVTSEHHTLFRSGYQIDLSNGFSGLIFTVGPGYLIYNIYTLLIFLTSSIIILINTRYHPKTLINSVLIVVGFLLPMTLVLLYNAGFSIIKRLDLSSTSFIVSGFLFSIALGRGKWLKMIPIARSTVVEYLDDPVIVIDHLGQIADLNRKAMDIFGLSKHGTVGTKIDSYTETEEWSRALRFCIDYKVRLHHLELLRDGETTYFEISNSPINNRLGQYLGAFFVFRDVTDKKQLDRTLLFLAEHRWKNDRINFFQKLCRFLSEMLGMELIRIDQLSANELIAHPLAVYNQGRFEENTPYSVQDTPCGQVLQHKICCYEIGVRNVFPSDKPLKEMEAESYIGICIYNVQDEAVGSIAAIGKKPLKNRKIAEDVLKLIAVPVAGEIERKRIETVLKQSEAQKQAILDGISVNIAFVNQNLEILWANKTAAKSVGKTPNQMIGEHCYRFWADPKKVCDNCPSLRAIVSKKSENSIVTTPDGRIWQEGGEPVFDESGILLGVVEIAQDITEKVIAEEALIESEQKYRFIADNLMDVIWVLNLNLKRFTYISPSVFQLRGYTVEEAMDQSIDESLDVESAKSVMENIPIRLKAFFDNPNAGHYYIDQLRQPCKDGSYIWVETSTRYHMNPDGEVEVIGISRDIRKRKQFEDALKSSLAEKDALLRELYHRTKNNMQVICSLLNLKMRYTDNEEVFSVFKDMENRILSMALVQQKLYQSKDLSSISLKEYIVELIVLISSSYGEYKKRVTFDTTKLEEVSLMIDSAIPCGLILNELITNSFKYAFPDKRDAVIRIELRRLPDQTVEIVVSDNGVGAPPEFDFKTGARMGIKTVYSIGEKQLRGSVEFKNENGLSCTIRFKDTQYQRRI